jgi:hypothetical protein
MRGAARGGVWIEHLRAKVFCERPQDVRDTRVYGARFGIPGALGSCHTAVIGSYAIQGHAPAREIDRRPAERQRARGLAVPRMPSSAPGMDGDRSVPYDVFLILFDRSPSVYARYPG